MGKNVKWRWWEWWCFVCGACVNWLDVFLCAQHQSRNKSGWVFYFFSRYFSLVSCSIWFCWSSNFKRICLAFFSAPFHFVFFLIFYPKTMNLSMFQKFMSYRKRRYYLGIYRHWCCCYICSGYESRYVSVLARTFPFYYLPPFLRTMSRHQFLPILSDIIISAHAYCHAIQNNRKMKKKIWFFFSDLVFLYFFKHPNEVYGNVNQCEYSERKKMYIFK